MMNSTHYYYGHHGAEIVLDYSGVAERGGGGGGGEGRTGRKRERDGRWMGGMVEERGYSKMERRRGKFKREGGSGTGV